MVRLPPQPLTDVFVCPVPEAQTDCETTSEIIKMRHGMWEKVAKRAHSIYKLYPFGASADEVMMYGAVDYEFKTGEKTSTDWAGRAHFSQEDGQLKMNYYQVYLVSSVHFPVILRVEP